MRYVIGGVLVLALGAALLLPPAQPAATAPRMTNTTEPTWTPGPTVTAAPEWAAYPEPAQEVQARPTWSYADALQRGAP